MADPAPTPDRDAQMLARLAELDLAAAERVHARLMAAEDAAEIAEYGRTYQRLSRSLRQTLALKAKLTRDREVAQAARVVRPEPVLDFGGFRVDARIEELQQAVGRVALAAYPNAPGRQRETIDRFDYELDDWVMDETFGLEDLDTHVLSACRALGLPDDIAVTWRKLPNLPWDFDPASRADVEAGPSEDAAPPPSPSADSG